MILVFGGSGMLGKEVVVELERSGIDYVAPSHMKCDITNPEDLRDVRNAYKPETIINCAGAIHSDNLVNSLAPWYISRIFPCRVLHISTDCVFQANGRGNYLITDAPRPDTPYGLSKLLGEQSSPMVTNIRTSFIGFDHGLLHWLMTREPNAIIQGYTRARWSGSTVYAVANTLVKTLELDTRNIEHMATTVSCSKHFLLQQLIARLRPDLVLAKSEVPEINRDLRPTIPMRPVELVLDELVQHAPS